MISAAADGNSIQRLAAHAGLQATISGDSSITVLGQK
jgi:hypothetical protein